MVFAKEIWKRSPKNLVPCQTQRQDLGRKGQGLRQSYPSEGDKIGLCLPMARDTRASPARSQSMALLLQLSHHQPCSSNVTSLPRDFASGEISDPSATGAGRCGPWTNSSIWGKREELSDHQSKGLPTIVRDKMTSLCCFLDWDMSALSLRWGPL